MELKEIIRFIIKKKLELFSMGIFFGILGLVVYFVFPAKYLAITQLYITRETQDLNVEKLSPTDQFSYEGYYAQQNAINHTTTLLGLIESDSIKSMLLENSNLPVTSSNLRVLSRSVSAKRRAPQVIEISVKSKEKHVAVSRVNDLTDIVLAQSQNLTSSADPKLFIVKVDETPIVKTTYTSVLLNFSIGFVLGFLISLVTLAFQEYMADDFSKQKTKK